MIADKIIVHCSDTTPEQDIGVKEIDEWHRSRGWNGCGYHYVIRRNGIIEAGRPLGTSGAHARGYNHCPGVCLVGGKPNRKWWQFSKFEANFTLSQYRSLSLLVDLISQSGHVSGNVEVVGHRDLPGVTKKCPCFDVRSFFENR